MNLPRHKRVLKGQIGEQELPPPECDHGPTLLFTPSSMSLVTKRPRHDKQHTSVSPNEPYYACSLSRDQKACAFRMTLAEWREQRQDEGRCLQQTDEEQKNQQAFTYLLDDHKQFGFCCKCGYVLVEDKNVPSKHQSQTHRNCRNRIFNISRKRLAYPSNLLEPMSTDGDRAQYFFSDYLVSFLVDQVILPTGYTRVVCLGCPTIHEQLLNASSGECRSLLLDIDDRFRQFYPPEQYIRFNMFNASFQDQTAESGKAAIERFMTGDEVAKAKTLVIMDPPFGGRVEPLASTIHTLERLMFPHEDEDQSSPPLSLMLIYPYFNEHWIRQHFARYRLALTDMIVTYNNHKHLKESSILSSPARLFTNLPGSRLPLMALNKTLKNEIYRWCSKDGCDRAVFVTNRHCDQCGQCTARDAKCTPVHCNDCNRCVKSSWVHCTRCGRCHLRDGKCARGIN